MAKIRRIILNLSISKQSKKLPVAGHVKTVLDHTEKNEFIMSYVFIILSTCMHLYLLPIPPMECMKPQENYSIDFAVVINIEKQLSMDKTIKLYSSVR